MTSLYINPKAPRLTFLHKFEEELMLFFRVMVRLCGKEEVRASLGKLDRTWTYANAALTWVHNAVESGFL